MSAATATTRARIIDAAIELFAAKGYPETSMKDIAALVGIKSPSIYNHFKSKEEILDTVLEEYISHSQQNTATPQDMTALIAEADPAELLERLFYSFAKEDAPRYSKILKVITHEQFREPKATAFIRDYLLGECQRNIQEMLELLIAAGKIRPVKSDIYAKLLISLTLASSIEMMFYGFDDYQNLERVPNRAARKFLIDQIVHGVE